MLMEIALRIESFAEKNLAAVFKYFRAVMTECLRLVREISISGLPIPTVCYGFNTYIIISRYGVTI